MRTSLLFATTLVATFCSKAVLSQQVKKPLEDNEKEERFFNRIAQFVRNGLAEPQAYIVELFQWKEVPEISESAGNGDEEYLGCRKALKLLQSTPSEMIKSEDSFVREILNTMKYTLQNLKGSVNENQEKSCNQLETQDQIEECEKVSKNLKEEALENLRAGLSEAKVCRKLAGATVAADYTGTKYGYKGSNSNGQKELSSLEWQHTAFADAARAVDNNAESEVEPSSLTGPYACKMCLTLVHLVDVAVAQDFEKVQEAREIIGDLCDSMSEQSTCHQFLAQFDRIVMWLKDGSDPKAVCAEVSMCETSNREGVEKDHHMSLMTLLPFVGSKSLEIVTVEKFADDHACVYCTAITTIIQYVDKYQKDSLHTIKTVLKYACKLVPKNCKCDEMEHHFDEIVKLVEEGKEPRDACKSIGICKDSDYFPEELASNKPSPQTIPFLLNELETFFSLDRCIYCDSITTLLQIIVDEEPDQVDEIRTYADMICEILGKDNECHTYVAQLDKVIDELKGGKHPREICVELKYCTSHSTFISTKDSREKSQLDSLPLDVEQGPRGLCYGFVRFLAYAWEREPRNVLKGLERTKSICMKSGGSVCPAILDSMERIMSMLQSNETPEKICGQVQMCTSASPLNRECIPCSMVLQTVVSMVKSKPEENSNVETNVDVLCDSRDRGETCRTLMKPFEIAMTSLKSNIPVADICARISSSRAMDDFPHEKEDMPMSSTHLCSGCKQNSALLTFVSSKRDKQAEAQMQLDGMCKLVPQFSDCQLWLKHRDAILKGVSEDENMDEICSRINQCPATKAAQHDKPAAFSMGCLFCDLVAEIISSAPDKQSRLQARRAIQAMCVILPPDARCDILAAKFDELADLLGKGSSPSSACHAVGLCQASGVEATSMSTNFEKRTFESLLNVMSEHLPSVENEIESDSDEFGSVVA
uniref:Uncharacterized protein AlNc14C65G4638 n=1 Tax=Albugo laibachii Nc14 TaxID=890382 RepID=F0WDB8_9STRA|nr:conserved hypothetical protein [Albugo laibachii Nc14]|eukprot:CCA19190.1 conserved hypothetical protein [Albugo laibachii Nc14]